MFDPGQDLQDRDIGMFAPGHGLQVRTVGMFAPTWLGRVCSRHVRSRAWPAHVALAAFTAV
eukprot:6104774-Prorocentrum_lima.AAC.1